MSLCSGLKGLLRIVSSNLHQKNGLFYQQIRNSRAEDKVKWVRPPKFKSYTPERSGDLVAYQAPDENSILKDFEKSEKFSKCSKEVLKLLSISNQSRVIIGDQYTADLVNKVKSHAYDASSPEVIIAKKTARIRLLHSFSLKYQRRSIFKCHLNKIICSRKKKLRELREQDYKKFEWLLEKLDIKYTAPIIKEKVARRKSVKLLAELQREKMKEVRIAECKKNLDELKIPFLEKKIQKLKWIMEKEAELKVEQTVQQKDIDECLKKIEEVKLEIEERQKKGYLRKIHPYTLEPYYPTKIGNT